MKALKDRNTVKISVAAYEKMLGWKRKRLARFTENVNELLQLPDIFGKYLTGGDVIDYMKKSYGIDIDELEVNVKYDKN